MGLKIHKGKSKVLKVNTVTDTLIMLVGEEEEEERRRTMIMMIMMIMMMADMRRNSYMWGELQQLAQDRDDWRVLIGGLCPRWGYRQ